MLSPYQPNMTEESRASLCELEAKIQDKVHALKTLGLKESMFGSYMLWCSSLKGMDAEQTAFMVDTRKVMIPEGYMDVHIYKKQWETHEKEILYCDKQIQTYDSVVQDIGPQDKKFHQEYLEYQRRRSSARFALYGLTMLHPLDSKRFYEELTVVIEELYDLYLERAKLRLSVA